MEDLSGQHHTASAATILRNVAAGVEGTVMRRLEVCARQEQAWVRREPMREALGSEDRSFRILAGSDPSMVLVVSGPGYTEMSMSKK